MAKKEFNIFNYLKKNTKNIFIITIVGFIAGIFLGFGGYIRYGSMVDTVAIVNGKKISLSRYNRLLNQAIENYRDQANDISDEVIKSLKQQVLRDLIQEEVFWQEAQKYGIVVTDQEVFYDIMRIPAFQKNGQFDRETYYRTLFLRLKTTPKEFELSRKKRIAMFKLREFILSGIKISEPELQMAYKEKKGSLKDFDKEKENFYTELLQEKQVAVLEEWYKQINNSVKIKLLLKDL